MARTIVFDVNETLLDLSPLDPLFERLFGSAGVRQAWFDRVLRIAMTTTLTGRYEPFGEVGWAAFEAVARQHGVQAGDEERRTLSQTMRSLPPHDDVVSGLKRLKNAGLPLATLTNSSQKAADAQIENAGLTSYFDAILSVDSVGKYKPHPDVYAYAAERLGQRPDGLRLVAAHAWDVTGAIRSGWRAAFVARPGQVLDALSETPDIVADSLHGVASQVLASDLAFNE